MWRPNFYPAVALIISTLVWVRFLEVLIEFFNQKFLLRMGNQLGKATKVDRTTTTVLRGQFARVCVEVDFNKPLIPCSIDGSFRWIWASSRLHLIHEKKEKDGNMGESMIMKELVRPVESHNLIPKVMDEVVRFLLWTMLKQCRRSKLGWQTQGQEIRGNKERNMHIGSQPISERIKELGKKKNEGISVNKTVLAGKRTTMTPMTFQMTHSGSRFAILNQEENEIATGDIKESATKITEKIQAIPKPKERVNFTGTIYTIGETSGVQKKPVTRTKKKVHVYLPVNWGKNAKSGPSDPSGLALHPIVEMNDQASTHSLAQLWDKCSKTQA
ncbi:hypothetical protein M9H77_01777 [Catharanthus roseus]|uniref:Uncharacterized protein n=1 Tax=Catharanthus roseus TaxID=4058 RepID=A0ACC0C6N0_CATRO|nr:hypothetical protein M9H77_01777 [Catharanthus roseus]